MSFEILLQRWSAALSAAEVELDAEVAEGWARLALGSEADQGELAAIIALHARRLGETGKPAHIPTLQAILLDPFLSADTPPRYASIAADAHAIGVATRLERKRQQFLRERLPVLELPSGEILAAPVGSMDGELLDATLGRAFTLAVGTGSRTVVLELSGVDPLDEPLLVETLAAFPKHELASKLEVVISGVADRGRLSAELSKRDAHDIRVIEALRSLNEASR